VREKTGTSLDATPPDLHLISLSGSRRTAAGAAPCAAEEMPAARRGGGTDRPSRLHRLALRKAQTEIIYRFL